MDLNKLMKQAQEMQGKVQEMQSEFENKEYEGKSGGGLVKIVVNGKSALKSLDIDKSAINPDEKEILEDLIIAAFNDAKKKAEEAGGEAMNSAFGGMNLPPGFKFPF